MARRKLLYTSVFPGRIDQPPTASTPQGWQGDFGWKFVKPFPVGEQQFQSRDVGLSASPTSVYGGYGASLYTYLPLSPDQIDFAFVPFPTVATPSTPQGWQGDFGLQFKRPLSPVLQQFIATRIDQPPTPAILWGYSAIDIGFMPLDPSLVDFAAPTRLDQPPTGATPQGWQGDFGWRFGRPYSVTLQQFFADMWQGAVATPAISQGWFGSISTSFTKPYPVVEQQFFATRIDQAQAFIPPTPGGWNVTPSYRFVKPYPAALQQFEARRIDQPGTAATPQGWQTNFDIAFGKRYPAAEQPYLGFTPQGAVPTAATAQGWWGYQPQVTGKRYPTQLQPFTGFQAFLPIPGPSIAQISPVDPYIYPGDKKKKKRLIDETLPELGIFDPRKLTRKQRKLLEQFEAQRWEKLTEGPTREQKLKEDMKAAIQEVLEKAERKRIEDAKVSGLFAAPPPVALEASLHAAIKVVKELERQHELDEARKALRRAKEEALAKVERNAKDAEKRVLEAKRAALKAKKAAQDAKLLATWRLKKKAEQAQVYDAVMDYLRPTKVKLGERADILDSVLDIARRKK